VGHSVVREIHKYKKNTDQSQHFSYIDLIVLHVLAQAQSHNQARSY